MGVEWTKDESGRSLPREIPGTEQIRPAQLILLAMGFLGPEDMIFQTLNVERDARSNVKAEYGKFATSLPGVFSAGDMRRGASLINASRGTVATSRWHSFEIFMGSIRWIRCDHCRGRHRAGNCAPSKRAAAPP